MQVVVIFLANIVPIRTGAHTLDREELTVEIRHVVVAALHSDLGYCTLGLVEAPTGLIDPQRIHEGYEGFARGRLEKPAERRGAQFQGMGDLRLLDVSIQISLDIAIDDIEALLTDRVYVAAGAIV